jgi:hypothetical protein
LLLDYSLICSFLIPLIINKKILTMKNVTKNRFGLLTLVIASFFILSSTVTFAQKANFAGSWNYIAEKSTVPEGGFRLVASKITATQDELTLNTEKVSKGRDGEDRITKDIITLDGKECENVVFGDVKRKSIATWSADGKSLTISSVMIFDRNGDKMEIKSSEVWKLSDDKSKLTLESSATTPNGEMKATLVYEKAK